ncbi:hypothetical protein BS47DRAFT_994524 [Hydnum rufescens UP504]|uniref:Secreted protein n=1 Tax=Hydnum rufescens UP504 TaxID=1448309 RepID=A0A9P6B9K0_9AGAM|nr:hypothetical protein BS47DRAFT_994524 [Hydnum rufescens UP504]
MRSCKCGFCILHSFFISLVLPSATVSVKDDLRSSAGLESTTLPYYSNPRQIYRSGMHIAIQGVRGAPFYQSLFCTTHRSSHKIVHHSTAYFPWK